MSKFFTAHRIFDNVTQIGGLGGELCYLIEGSEKALLIDGLSGVGSLKAFVRELTDLPVVGLMREVEAAIGTEVRGYTLTIHYLCPQCRAKQAQ